ncbi:MAG: hypothetical protein R2716_13335 [Microthrixaceae bacterium]
MFGLFLESVGITVADGLITLPPSDTYPEGRTFTDGEECPAEGGGELEPGQVALYQWLPQAGENTGSPDNHLEHRRDPLHSRTDTSTRFGARPEGRRDRVPAVARPPRRPRRQRAPVSEALDDRSTYLTAATPSSTASPPLREAEP